jgi:RHS repeat-associated protein
MDFTTDGHVVWDRVGQVSAPTAASTTHLYYSAQGQIIEERQGGTAAADVSHQYVWSLAYVNALVLRDDYQAGVLVPADRLYAQQDANFNTMALVNISGSVVERYTYSAYGLVTVLDASGTPVPGNTSAYGWQYLFQGGRLDSVTGNVQFAARDYDPSTGVWTQPDPSGFSAGDPNFYRYVGNQPTGFVDPSGLAETPPGGWNWWAWDGAKAFASSIWGNTVGAIIETGSQVGEQIGTGAGAFFYSDPGRAIDLSTTRQRNALAEAAQIPPAYMSQRTIDQIAAERASAIANGSQEIATYGDQILDGSLAAAELAIDVSATVQGGLAARRLLCGSTGAFARAAAPNSGSVGGMDPNALRFSQRSAGGSGRAAPLRESMKGGWNGPAVDAVETAEGVVSIDNTRVAIARELGIKEIPVNVHLPSDPLPESMLGRFGDARTWGEALAQRTGKQRPPLPFGGTPDTPRLPK